MINNVINILVYGMHGWSAICIACLSALVLSSLSDADR